MALNLTLEVLQVPEWEVGDAWRKVFDDAGGRIGRAFDCDWILSNPYISRHHATVSCVEGVFYIEGVGENGVAVNDPDERLPRRQRHALKDGDHLFLDEYEITVAIADADEVTSTPTVVPPLEIVELSLPVTAPVISTPAQTEVKTQPATKVQAQAPKLVPELMSAPPATYAPPPVLAPLPTLAPPPVPVPPRILAPVLAPPSPPAPVQLPREKTSPVPAAARAIGFDGAAFLNGAGLDPRSVPPEMAATLGQIVRAVVQGLIDVLRARAEFRDQFRLPLTRVQMSQNNPLKFAINAEDALAVMLRPSSAGYLPALEAFDDAFDDIRFHQLAMLAGMRAGFESMTSRFEPKKLMEQSDRHRQGSLSKLGAKGRYWDRYVDLFEEVATNPDTGFRRLYGEEFSDAYEQQLEDLKRNRAKASV